MAKDLSLSVVNTHTKPPTTSTARLSWATSVFYFGMLAGLLPMTLTLQRFQLGRVLGGVVMLWGLIAMLTAAVTSFRGLYAQRFFLGFVESIIPTGFMCIVSGYYTQEEQSLRQSWWFSSTGGWTIIGGALNYGFAQIKGGALKRWQYIYLFAGALTILFGIICFAIPNSAVTAWFLSPEERRVAVERLRKGQTGVRCQKIKWSQIQEGLLDIKVWLVALMMAGAYVPPRIVYNAPIDRSQLYCQRRGEWFRSSDRLYIRVQQVPVLRSWPVLNNMLLAIQPSILFSFNSPSAAYASSLSSSPAISPAASPTFASSSWFYAVSLSLLAVP